MSNGGCPSGASEQFTQSIVNQRPECCSTEEILLMKHLKLKPAYWSYCIGVAFLALCSSPSWAECTMYVGEKATVTVQVPSTLSIPRDAADGTEIYRSNSLISYGLSYVCLKGGRVSGYVNNVGLTSATGPSPIGSTGLGWRLVLNDAESVPYPSGSQAYGEFSYTGTSVGIRLYKIGPVSPGSIDRTILGSMRHGDLDVVSIQLSNAIAINALSCETPSINVNLGHQFSGKFDGVGSTIGKKSFNILLNNCPAGLAVGGVPYRLDPVNPAYDALRGILALDKGGATGVGIQITDGLYDSPIQLGVRNGHSGPPGVTTQRIPFKAAYYQTADTVQGGKANASLQFTLFYR